jgi:hypothetical protein
MHPLNLFLFQAQFPDTVYGHATTETRLHSATADDLAWARYTTQSSDEPRAPSVQSALSRVSFTELASPRPLHAALSHIDALLDSTDPRSKARVFVVAGRGRRLAAENHAPEVQNLVEEHGPAAAAAAAEVRKTAGDVATAFVVARTQVGLLVLQAPLAHAA